MRRILVLFVVLLLLTAGCSKKPATPVKTKSPEEVFLEYSNAIDLGEYEIALKLCVVDSPSGFIPMEKHQILQKKLVMTEAYGKNGEKFSIINIEIDRRENLKDRVRLHYRMRYSLDGKESEIKEYIDLVMINGTWRVVFP